MLKKLAHGLLLGAAAGLLSLALGAFGLLERWENLTWDWRVRQLARPAASTDRIKLIVLDQASLDWAKEESSLSWPWPRQVYGFIIDYLSRAGARVIAFDVLFTEPSNISGDDQTLGQAISQGPPFAGAVILGKHTGGATIWPPELVPKTIEIKGLTDWLAGAGGGVAAQRAALPVPEVAAAAALLGNVAEDPEPDQVVRRASLFKVFDGRAIPSLALAAYLTAGRKSLSIQPGRIQIGEKVIPIDGSGRAILNFRGPPGTHGKYSAAAVMQSELQLREGKPPTIKEPEIFKDCFVLFGFTAPGLHDLRSTPASPVYPGVEVHATALDNLLAGDFIRPAPGTAAALTTLILGLLAGLAGAAGTRAWHNVLAFGVFLTLPPAGGWLAYGHGVWWPVVTPELAAALALVGTMVLNYATEGRQRRFIRRAFGQYLSPLVIEQIVKDPGRLELGGERRELSIFFSDLQGFTSISEKLDPAKLTGLLNEFLSDMTEIILDEGGTLDKYEGDAIIAFWNAPLDQPDHALRACRAALRCQQKLVERREYFQDQAGSPLFMRVGVNTGPVVVGNLGSKSRFDYTVLGDAANLASRLEGANKVFGTGIMISETTWEQVREHLSGRELGSIKVVGRANAVRVFEPLGYPGQVDAETCAAFNQGLELCRLGDCSAALKVFEELKEDSACRAYAKRLRQFLSEPKEAWDAVWNLTSK